jgi:predicted ATPase
MIETLHIENFRCLRDVKMTLGPFTVLVGANASGKSSAIASLEFACTGNDHWGRLYSKPIRVTIEGDGRTKNVRTYKDGGTTGEGTWWPNIQVLRLDPGHIQQSAQVQESRRIEATGSGLPNLFATLTRKEQDQVAHQFGELVPMFQDVAVRPQGGGNHRFVFQDRWKADLWYEPQQVSDGTLLILAYLLLPYQTPVPDLVAIEEPERGLHPFLLGEVVSTLRKLATGQLGTKPVQIILATHSADLLEHVDPSEVRFFHRRQDTGETVVREAPTTNPDWPKLLREYDNSLGDLWLSGGLGGVPGA